MANSIGQYQYNQQNPNKFTGDSNNAIQYATTNTVQGVQTDPVKTVASIGAGLGMSKGVDLFVNSMVQNGPKSKLAQLMDKINNSKMMNNPVHDKLDKFFKGISNKFENYKSNNPNFVEGYNKKTWLAQAPIKTQVLEDLNSEFENVVKAGLGKNQSLDKAGQSLLDTVKSYEFKPNKKGLLGTSEDTLAKELTKAVKSSSISNKNAVLSSLEQNSKKLNLIGDKISILNKTTLKNTSGLSKALSNMTFGLGQIFGGSNFTNLAMNGGMLGLSIKSAVEAKPGEKVSTFMEDMSANYVGNWVGMLAIAPFYNGIASQLEKNGSKNLLGTIGRKAGSLMNLGHGTNMGLNKAWLLKGLPGGIFRLLVMSYASTKLFGNPLKKLSHAIFGKPTDPELLKKQQEQQQLMAKQQLQPNQIGNPSTAQETNMQTKETTANQTTKTQEPQRSYIPTPNPNPNLFNPQVNSQENKTFNDLISKTDGVINYAEGDINGNKQVNKQQNQ